MVLSCDVSEHCILYMESVFPSLTSAANCSLLFGEVQDVLDRTVQEAGLVFVKTK